MRIRAYMTALGVALLGTIAVAQSVNYDKAAEKIFKHYPPQS